MPINSFDNYPLTWKPDKQKLRPPYYKSLAEDLENNICGGLLKPGTKLPPQRELADYLDLNYTTITRVYDICKKKGLIYGTTGKGTFVAPHASETIDEEIRPDDNACIDLGVVSGFTEYSELVEKATSTVVQKGYLRNLYEYSLPAGHPHQLAAGVRWMEQLGTHTDREHTAIFSGAQNALTVALMTLFAPGDKIAVDRYIYPQFIALAKLLHLVLIAVDGDAEGMSPAHLEKQCHTNRIRGIYLIPTCANPTTVTMPLSRRQALADVIRKHNLILMEDDIVAWMSAAGGTVIPSMFDLMNGDSVYICGMTQSLCPGLRIAYMTYSERYREQLLYGLTNINIKSSAFDAEVITELILSGDAYAITKRKYRQAKKNSLLYEQYFPADNPFCETVSYFKWLPVSVNKTAEEVESELLAAGVRVYHSERFSVIENREKSYLRISLCAAGSTKNLERGLDIVRDYLHHQYRK